MGQSVTIRVIANEEKRRKFFQRAEMFRERNNLQLKILQDEPYWKIEGLFEIMVEIYPAPVWNYGNWSAAFNFCLMSVLRLNGNRMMILACAIILRMTIMIPILSSSAFLLTAFSPNPQKRSGVNIVKMY